MSTKLDPVLSQIETALIQARGEIYNFINNGKKKSAAVARKCLLTIRKACADGRKELQNMKSALPIRRRVLSEATKAKMAAARAAKKAAKEAKAK